MERSAVGLVASALLMACACLPAMGQMPAADGQTWKQYDIAPYSSGIVEFVIPYQEGVVSRPGCG